MRFVRCYVMGLTKSRVLACIRETFDSDILKLTSYQYIVRQTIRTVDTGKMPLVKIAMDKG